MEMLSVQELKIIQYIHDFTGATSADLATYFNVSMRKCQLDVIAINHKLNAMKGDIAIHVDRLHGYSLRSLNHKTLTAFGHELRAYLDQSLLGACYKSEKVIQIVRLILLNHESLKIDDIAQTLNMSVSSVHVHLKEARKIFENYDINLRSIPYHGYKVDASAMKRISALLDYCDIPLQYTKTSVIEPMCVEAYCISATQLESWKKRSLDIITNFSLRLSENGFRRVVLLACLIENDTIDFSNLIVINAIKSSRFYTTAKAFGFEGSRRLCMAYLLQSYQESHLIVKGDTEDKLRLKTSMLYQSVRDHLSMDVGIDVGSEDEFPELFAFMHRFLTHKMLHVLEFSTSNLMVAKLATLVASQSFAFEILRLLGNHPVDAYHANLTYELILIIYNKAACRRSEYDAIRCLIVNDGGALSSKLLKNRLNLSGFDVMFKTVYNYELAMIDYTAWDFIVSASVHGKPEACPIPFFRMNYFSDFQKSRAIWKKIISKRPRKIDFIHSLELAQTISINESRVTIASKLYHLVLDYGGKDLKHFQTILATLNHHVLEGKTTKITLCLCSNTIPTSRRILVTNKHIIRIADQAIDTFEIIIMKPVNDMLAIKQIDSAYRER